MVSELLFVYGTLRKEFRNPFAILLNARARYLGKGTIKGQLVNLGYFPGLIPSDDHIIKGDLYSINPEEDLFTLLDEYEGDDFERKRTEVAFNGESILCWTYFYKGEDVSDLIDHNDYLTYYEKKKGQPK